MLAQTLTSQDEAQGRQKRKAAFVGTDGAEKKPRVDAWPKGQGKGNWQKGSWPKGGKADGKGKSGGKQQTWGGKALGKGPCHQWQQKGSCEYGQTCKFAHGGGKGGKDKSKTPCRQWQQGGKCERGADCWFAHGKAADGAASGPAKREGK